MVEMKVVGIAIAIGLVLLYAVGSGFFIDNSGWYQSLNKPTWQPPDIVFGLIWPYNFIMLGVSGFIVVRDASSSRSMIFLVFLALSVVAALAWSYFFYQPHDFTRASIALGLAALFTLPLLILTLQTNALVGILLIPYQGWLVIATLLSVSYGKLN
jgi:tryptophan-rich sensory protein